jgi:oxalate decarboxylase
LIRPSWNVGDTDLQFVGVVRAPRYEEVSLSNGPTHTPPKLVAQHLNVNEKLIAHWADDSPGILPKS